VPLGAKLRYAIDLFRDHRGRARDPESFAWLFADLDEYDELLTKHAGRSLAQAKVFEIGYGARPYRLLALQSITDASGVDAEAPIIDGRAKEWLEVLRRNGVERLAKSLVRHTLFDRDERTLLRQELARRGTELRWEKDRFLVADAASLRLEPGSLDLVTSEDVFEHIPRASLERICAGMAGWLKPTGLALIRPNVYTGITGGHHLDWNRRSFTVPGVSRETPPWAHLRGLAAAANTYLNHLSLADYRALFATHFEILEERVVDPSLGREYLTPDVAQDLTDWSEEELFSNQVLFVLRPLPT